MEHSSKPAWLILVARLTDVRVLLVVALFAAGCRSTDPGEVPQKGWIVPRDGAATTNPPSRLDSTIAPAPEPDPSRTNLPPKSATSSSPSLTEGLAALESTPPTATGKVYSFSAKQLDIQDALALFARNNGLNIVPDPDISGQLTVEFRDLPLEQSMEAILDTFNYFAEIDGGLIRVRKMKTEFFSLNYIRLVRSGNGSTAATISSSSASGGDGGSGGGGGGGGGSGAGDSTSVSISKSDSIRFWDELEEQLKSALSAEGKLAINRMVGSIMVTDHKLHVDRIGKYLEELKRTLHLQVDLEAQIFEVVLNNEFHFGIDWQNVMGTVQEWAISSGGPGTAIPSSRLIVDNPLGGLQPGSPALSLAITKDQQSVLIDALEQQGRIEVVSQPRVRTLNNQAAMIKVGTDKPFFRKSAITTTGTGPSQVTENVEVQSITIGTVLALTPQISEDGWVTIDISPVITRLVDSISGPDGTTAPEVDIKQTSSLVRIRENTTVVIGGLIQNERHKTVRKVPILGSIPILGYPFRGVFENKRRTELVIFITPSIVR